MSMLFTDQEKRIYGPYDDGSATVFGDPHKINRTLLRLLDGDPNRWLQAYRSEDVVEQFEATNRLVDAAVGAFELTSFDKKNGKGMDEKSVIKLLKHFVEWMQELKKKDEPTPTGSNVSAGPKVVNPGNPSEKAFLDEREKDHERLKKQMASLSRVGLPSG